MATRSLSHATVSQSVEDLAAVVNDAAAVVNELATDRDAISNYVDFLDEDGVIGGDFTVTIGAAVTLTGAGHIRYRIGGEEFYVALDTTIALTDDGDVDDTKWRAWRIEIDRTGAVTGTADGDTQHANEEDALLNLSTVAPTSNTATLGYFTINSDTGFAVGDDNVNGETAANFYTVRGPRTQVSALHSDLGADVAVGSTPTNFSHGTIDVKRNGVYLAQISAGADVAFDDADALTSHGDFGGHLLVVGLNGTSVYALAADGNAGAASTMTYATAAAASTALDTLADQLPEVFVPFGKIVVEAHKNTFAYGTDDIAGTDGTATYSTLTAGTWDQSATTGYGSHVSAPPTPPAPLTNSDTVDSFQFTDPTTYTPE